MIRSRVIGCGAYLPSNIVTNDDLAKKVDTSDAWIRERTGIRQRHIALPSEKTSDLALGAARAALTDAGIDAGELDMIICATTTPDESFPVRRHHRAVAAWHTCPWRRHSTCRRSVQASSMACRWPTA